MQRATAEADGLQRFIQEYALLAQIQHPNVARIFRQDFSVAHAYIAMEYFARYLRAHEAGPFRPKLSYIKQTAAGLAAIHDVGIVHRDLKPDNLMFRQDGSLALADFGVAKQTSMKITDTGDGDIVGTPYYLSPEQALGQPVDARCDIYSLGVLAFELLTGASPTTQFRAGAAAHACAGPVPDAAGARAAAGHDGKHDGQAPTSATRRPDAARRPGPAGTVMRRPTPSPSPRLALARAAGHDAGGMEAPPRVPGFRLLRQIGQGRHQPPGWPGT